MSLLTYRRSARTALAVALSTAPIAMLGALALGVAAGVLPALSASSTRSLINLVAGPGRASSHEVVVAAAKPAIFAGVATASLYVTGLINTIASRQIQREVEGRLYAALDSKDDLSLLDDPSMHNSLAMAEEAAAQAPTTLTSFAVQLVMRVFSVISFLTLVFTEHSILATLLLVCGVPSIAFQVILSRNQAVAIEQTVDYYRLSDYYRSVFVDPTSAKEIKTLGVGSYFVSQMRAAISLVMRSEIAAQTRTTLVQTVLALANAVVIAVTVAIVAVQVNQTGTDPGSIVLFLAGAIAIQGAVSGTALDVGSCIVALRLFGHYIRIVEAAAPKKRMKALVPPLIREVTFDDVWFKYPTRNTYALEGISFRH